MNQPSATQPAWRKLLPPSLAVLAGIVIVGCALLFDPKEAIESESRMAGSQELISDPRSLLGLLDSGERSISSLSSIELQTLLDSKIVSGIEESRMENLGFTLPSIALAEESNPENLAARLFPKTAQVLAMLARDRDVDDYLENASEKGAAGDYYQAVVELVPEFKPLRSRFESLYLGTFEGLNSMGRAIVPEQSYPESTHYETGVTLPGLSSKPREREYGLSHTYALDIFLKDIETVPGTTLEIGPMIFSLTDGIVIAAESNWVGGEDLDEYRSGGITPKAGNGIIIYSPSEKMYYLYFHLYDVLLEPGMTIKKGQPLGRGGNTGTNARKPGHGEHLHLEIYDSKSGRFLKNREIANIVF